MDSSEVLSALQASLDADMAVRKQAEAQLRVFEQQPHFTAALLDIAGADSVNLGTQIAAAIFFKNRVFTHWQAPENKPALALLIPELEKPRIKEALIETLVKVYRNPQIKTQLAAALNLIFGVDKWELIIDIVVKLLQDTLNIDHVYVGLVILFEYTKNYRFDVVEVGKTNPVIEEAVDATFPLLEQLVPTLLELEVAQRDDMLYMILKTFKFATYVLLPTYLQDFNHLGQWCHLLITIINHPMPALVMAEEPLERAAHPRAKAVKWCFGNFSRLLLRHGGGLHTHNKQLPFVQHFLELFVPEILQAYWKVIEQWSTRDVWLSEGALYHLIAFLEQLIETPDWPLVGNNLDAVIKHVVLPTLLATAETVELYEDDTDEYTRRFFDFNRDTNTLDVALVNFVYRLAAKRFAETGSVVLSNINDIFAARAASRLDGDVAKKTEGALRVLATISDKMSNLLVSPVAGEVDKLLYTYVYPEMAEETVAQTPWLAARACDTLAMFEHKYKDAQVLQSMFELAVRCYQTDEFPIKITAVDAICTLVREDAIANQVAPQAPQLMELLLQMLKKFELDILTNVMQTFVERFSKVLEPFATDLARLLVDHFVTVATELGEQGYGSDADTEKEYQALGILNTLLTLVVLMGANQDVGRLLEHTVHDMIKFIFDNAMVNFVAEAVEILELLLYATQLVLETMWDLYLSCVEAFETYAFEYFDQITPFFEAIINHGFKLVAADSPHVQAMFKVCTEVLTSNGDPVFANKAFELLELSILALGLRCAPMLPGYLPQLFSIFQQYEEQNSFDGYMLHHLLILKVLFSSLYADAAATMAVIRDNQFVTGFMLLWVKHSHDFHSVYGCKLQILAGVAILRSNDCLALFPEDCVLELVDIFFGNVAALPGALKARAEILAAESKFVEDTGDEVFDEEYGVDEAELEALRQTPIDDVNVFEVVARAVVEMKQLEPQKYETIFGDLDDSHKQLLQLVVYSQNQK